jgi:hypothetical protein
VAPRPRQIVLCRRRRADGQSHSLSRQAAAGGEKGEVLGHDLRNRRPVPFDATLRESSGMDIGLPSPGCGVPTISSRSRDQAIFVDHAADASVPSYSVLPEDDRWG